MGDDVERIKEKLDIVDVVNAYVDLQNAGRNYKGLSPFTNERTPSFFVSPDRQLFHCFSSGKGGDIFTFVQEVEGVDFRGALTILADKAGVTLSRGGPKSDDKRDRLFEVLDAAASFFETRLAENDEAQGYLERRGVTPTTIGPWRIGYAPDQWRSLLEHLRKKNFRDQDILAAGLIKERQNPPSNGGERYYDTFRDRIVFPVFDTSGRVVGFSGRILHEKEGAPKYLNSPETSVFDKSEVLYGLDRAKTAIRRQDYAVLVEGQMDLIMSHQVGLANTVASSGTALTGAQLEKLRRLSTRLIVAFDSDSAGFQAAAKNAELGMSMGMEVKVAQLPEGEDPADLIADDPQRWRDVLARSQHVIEFYVAKVLEQESDERRVGRRVREEVLPLVAKIESTIEVSHFVSRIAEQTGIAEQALWDDLKTVAQNTYAAASSAHARENGASGGGEAVRAPQTRREAVERELLGILLWNEGADEPVVDPAKLAARIEEVMGAEEYAERRKEISGESGALIFQAEAKYAESEMLEAAVEDLVQNLELETIRERFTRTMFELGKAEKEGDNERRATLLGQCNELAARLSQLQGNQGQSQ